jgi:hypothetical protein
MDVTDFQFDRLFSVCVVLAIGQFAGALYRMGLGRRASHGSRASTLLSVEESRTEKPQWCILRIWEFAKSPFRPT